MHGKCPEGESSWCFYKRAIAKGETPGSHSSMKTYLSPQVVEKIMPVYQRLASDTILERCVAGKTQNSNESLHSCIWRKCPKEVFVSKRRLEIAVTDAIEKHNLGYVKSLEAKEDSCLNDSFSLTIAERKINDAFLRIFLQNKKEKEMPRIQMQPIVPNRRDQSQITHLGRQLYPRKVKFFQECYADATSKPYGYLLIDLKPETDESLRVRTAKKFVLVPEERVQVTEHLSELDQRMKNILHNKDLTEEEKTILYLRVLQKYTHFSNENRRESEPVPNEASLSENQETESLKENLKESVVNTEKEVFEDEIFRIVPARYKEKAKNIFQFLKLQESFSWNSDGEIIYKNTVIPRSNIAFLVNDFLRNRKSAPEGRYVFLRALNDVNLPKNLDVNKKLYQSNKIIKKPIMYARRNAWLKL
ncbi:uncharacterized protein TNCV_1281601 [Trichonephila clavipes]|nr:uncharacterized protein TNCV_1281601 [Trichonephila clavipes]